MNSLEMKALHHLYPQVMRIVNKDAFDGDGNPVAYSEAAVQAYIDANAYKEQRAAEYPSFADQLDTLYHGGYDAWKAEIQAVKDKYPKGQA